MEPQPEDEHALVQEEQKYPFKQLSRDVLQGMQLGAKNFVLAYNIRAGIGVVIRIFRLLRQGKFQDVCCLTQLLGEQELHFRVDAVRLGLFVGWFTGGYKCLLQVCRYLRQKQDGWNSFCSGAIAAVAIGFLDKVRRRTLALYLCVRVMQCGYNGLKSRGLWHFWGSSWKHGDALLFILTSAQVMYAYVMRPETLPPSYLKFITQSGPVSKTMLGFVLANNRGEAVVPANMREYLHRVGSKYVYSINSSFPPALPCNVVHDQSETCLQAGKDAFLKAVRMTFPLYMSLHIVPQVVLKLKRCLMNPLKTLYLSTYGAAQSTVFLGVFVASYQLAICGHRKLFTTDNKFVYWVAGIIASMAIFIEQKQRRSELALYVLPRAADSVYMILKDRRLLNGVPCGDVFLFSFSTASVMYFYQNESKNMSPVLKKILRRFLE